MTTNFIGGAPQLRPGIIVSFRFPLGEGEGFAKSRPCLVIATSRGADGEPRVTIAYGTSAVTRSNRGLDLDLSDPQEWAAAGLRRPSRFVLMRRVTVALSDCGLDRGKTGSPVIGVLPHSAIVTMRRMTRFLGATITEDRPRGAPPAKEVTVVREKATDRGETKHVLSWLSISVGSAFPRERRRCPRSGGYAMLAVRPADG